MVAEGELSSGTEVALPTPELRAKFVQFVDLMRLLADCVIADDYSIPDVMNGAIGLTAAGDALFHKVVMAKTDRIPAKEARLLCALAIGQHELFVDLEATDLDGLARSIGDQISSGRIRFPFSFGREAYDAYARLFEEGQPLLTYAETVRLLDAIPMGVQQYGRYVTGPFGLQISASNRQVNSGRRIEAFHCSDAACEVVHGTHLATSEKATINAQRERFNAALGGDDSKSTDWFGTADEIRDLPTVMFSDTRVGVVANLIGDALDDDELRALVAQLLDETRGELRTLISSFTNVGDAVEATAKWDRARLLQIALLAREDQLQQALDALVESGKISVPTGEVRQPVVNRDRRSGAFALLPELGKYGLRFASPESGFAMLRLRSELVALTDDARPEESEELEWQIRHIDGESVEERLDTFFRVTDPAECLERLVMPRRAHVTRLANSLGITQGLGDPNQQIVERFLWKLGYALHDEADPREEFWRLHQRLLGLVKASHTPGSRDTEEFLGTASKFFREFERYLTESLAFAAWSLRHDHVTDPNPFEFGLDADYGRGMQFVQEAADDAEDGVMAFDYLSEKLDIYTLIRGFEFLSKSLVAIQSNPSAHLRPLSGIPAYARGSRLKKFPFTFTVPFLNLTDRSQARIAEQLREVARSLQRGKVNEIRNGLQHYRKTQSGVEQIESALREIEISMRSLEACGFGLIEFRTEDTVQDRWGRSEFYFAAPRGARHVVTRPSAYDWLGLPELDTPQYVAPAAIFAEPNEVLRFRRRLDSPYRVMWNNYPDRRRARSSALSQDRVERSGTEATAS